MPFLRLSNRDDQGVCSPPWLGPPELAEAELLMAEAELLQAKAKLVMVEAELLLAEAGLLLGRQS